MELDGNILIIEAEKVNPVELKEGENWVARLRERGYGKIRRSFRIPHSIDLSSAKVKLEDGLLTVCFTRACDTKKFLMLL